jgi:hypothetical protein
MSLIRYKKYWAGICLVLIPPNSMGTTILVVLQGDKVWIATDSLQRSNTREQRYACKINSEGGFYWAAGSLVYEDEEAGYSIKRMVSEAASTKGTLLDAMNALIVAAKVDSAKEFSLLKRTSPMDFSKLIQPDHTILVAKVIFIGKGNGHPPKVIYTILVAREIHGKIIISGTPIIPPAAHISFELGSYLTAEDYFLAHQLSPQIDPAPIMRDGIVAEEKAHPLNIGGRVSVLEISPTDSHWREKGECQ